MSATPKPSQAIPIPVPTWQQDWQTAFRSVAELVEFLRLDPKLAPQSVDLSPSFPLRVPRSFAERMRPGDWNDPLLRQVLPLRVEREEVPGFTDDAVGDAASQAAPGLLRKYAGRALLMIHGSCAVHCRYCFRREFPYADLPAAREDWERVYAQLAEDPEVEEILFSGGDPLSLSDARLRWHWERAIAVPGLRRLRIHSRLPVVLPNRVTPELLNLISETSAHLPCYFVLHVNHANEIDSALEKAIAALRRGGALVLNQSVLLRGVNDSEAALTELSLRLLDLGVLPYYLHQLDRVRGAAHFEVEEKQGLDLMDALRRRLPGYALPRYVREIAGQASKMPVMPRSGASRPSPSDPETVVKSSD